jgi:hypothetical protein
MRIKNLQPWLTGAIIVIVLALVGLIGPSVVESESTGSILRFYGFFLGGLMTFIYFILWLGRRYYRNMPQRVFSIVEMTIIGLMLAGVVAMFQPWSIIAYRIGFNVVLVMVFAFTAWSHIVPKGIVEEGEEDEPVAIAATEA